MKPRDAALSAFPSPQELDAFFLNADEIQRVPDHEDTDEGIAAFLLRARRASTETSAEQDVQPPFLPSNTGPLGSTALGEPSFRYSSRGTPQEGNDIRNISTTSSTSAPAATGMKGEPGTVKGDAAATSKPKPRRSSSAPKKTENFELRLPEYAVWLQENYTPSAHGKLFDFQALKDQTVFLAVSDVGKPKIERERLITIRRLGGTLSPSYDSSTVTMVVTTNKAVDSKTLPKLLGVTSVATVPAEIKIVLWDWVVECQHAETPEIPVACNRFVLYEDRHKHKKPVVEKKPVPAPEVAPEAPQAGPSRLGSKRRKKVDDADSDFSDKERKEREAQRRKLSVSHADDNDPDRSDPLREYYDEAQAQLAEEQSSQEDIIFDPKSDSDDASTDHEEFVKLERATKGFACLQPPRDVNEEIPNQFIIDKLKELKDIYASKQGEQDHFKVYNLNKVIGDLSRLKTKITTHKEALQLQGSGKKTADKIMEIVETGDLRRIKNEDTEEYRVCKLFAGIYDVGAKRAYKWYQMGLRTLEDVETRKEEIRLTSRQAIGLKYYADLQQRIPRHEAAAIFEKIRQIAMSIDGNLTLYIMGSFRRGEMTCGDVDLLLTRDPADGITHAGVLHRLLEELHAKGILTEDLSVPDDDGNLEAKYMGLCRLSPRGKMRRIDILTIPWEQKGAALIYFTGDDLFNRSLRLLAHKKGYSLNQRGLYGGIARDPKTKAKTTEGFIVASKTEEEIFALLDVPYRPPHERRRA